ncbi:MAG: ABC transporter permease [Anaerolineae bacterium]
MRAVLDIALNDLRIIFRDRMSLLLNVFIIPLVIAFAAGAANGAFGDSGSSTGPSRLPIDVIDQDHSTASQNFQAAIRAANPQIVLCPDIAFAECSLDGDSVIDDARATQRLIDQVSLALVIIPEGFEAALNSGGSTNITYRSNEDATAPSYLLQAVQAAAQQIGGAAQARQVGLTVAGTLSILTFADDADRAAFAADVQQHASDLWASDPVTVSVTTAQVAEAEQSNAGGGFSQSFPGIGTMYAMFSVFPLMATFLDERRNWTLQRLTLMPISRAQILAGKLLARFSIGMMQYVVVFGVGLLIGVRYGSDPVAIVLLMITYVLCVTALALMISTLVRTSLQAQGLTLFLSLTLAPLGGAWWPLDIVPEAMRIAGHISPVAWAMDGYQKLIFYNGTLVDILPMIGVLIAMGLVCFFVGVRRFRFE